VLDAGQLQFLKVRCLSVSDVLNGRYPLSDRPAMLTWMRSVNASTGGKVFFPESC